MIGQKRCQVCEIYLDWQGTWCPCCGYRLRIRPRNGKYKLILRTVEYQKKSQFNKTLN
jgi:hypothetical protein